MSYHSKPTPSTNGYNRLVLIFTRDLLTNALSEWFDGSTAATLKYGNISSWNTSNVTDMSELFKNSTITSGVGDWNVNNVTDMSSMFEGATDFQENLSDWNVSNVTDFTNMFLNATEMSPQNISGTPTEAEWSSVVWDNLQSAAVEPSPEGDDTPQPLTLDQYRSFVKRCENSNPEEYLMWTIDTTELKNLLNFTPTANSEFDVIINLRYKPPSSSSQPYNIVDGTSTTIEIKKIIRFNGLQAH